MRWQTSAEISRLSDQTKFCSFLHRKVECGSADWIFWSQAIVQIPEQPEIQTSNYLKIILFCLSFLKLFCLSQKLSIFKNVQLHIQGRGIKQE